MSWVMRGMAWLHTPKVDDLQRDYYESPLEQEAAGRGAAAEISQTKVPKTTKSSTKTLPSL